MELRTGVVPVFAMALFLVAIAFFYQKKIKLKIAAGFFLLLSHGCLGFILGFYSQASQNHSIFWKQKQFNTSKTVHIRIDEPISNKEKSWRSIAQVLCLKGSKDSSILCSGKVLIYWSKNRNKSKPSLCIGDVLIVSNEIIEIPQANFPDGFNYKSIMKHKNIGHQLFLDSSNFLYFKGSALGIFDYAKIYKEGLIAYIAQVFPKDISGLVHSLCLGHKDNLKGTDSASFAKSGTMHILAVSGLHVGMVYIILNILFSLGGLFRKYKKTRTFLILFFLWIYAFVTGLGASVIRASLMFTIIEIGRTVLHSNSNSFNSVFASAYLQLLIFPMQIVDVGFQLSYLAVLGILFFYPKIEPLLKPPTIILKKMWQLACISTAATFGTLPLTFYYFHTFPVWFILSNICLVPLGMLCLASILVSLALFKLPFLGVLFVGFTTWVLRLLLKLVHLFSELPLAQLHTIYMMEWEVLFYLVLMPVLAIGLYKRSIKIIFVSIGIVCLYSLVWTYTEHKRSKQFIVVASEHKKQLLLTVVEEGVMYNISSPMARVESNHLLELQKGFIQRHFIRDVSWVYAGVRDTLRKKNWSLIRLNSRKSMFLSEEYSPVIVHWKSNPFGSEKDTFLHLMAQSHYYYSDTTIAYKLLKRNFFIIN